MVTRAELKQAAKDRMKEQAVNPVLVTLVYLLAAIALSLLSGILGVTVIIPLVISIVSVLLEFGYLIYCMKVARREQGAYENLAVVIKDWRFGLKLFALTFVIGVFTMLWSLLFFIPGLIKAISYSQAVLIMIDNPNMGIMEAIKESQKLMNGHKMEFFILDLSFILWLLLVSVTFGIASVWVTPYMQITMVNYYDALRNQTTDGAKVVLEY